MKASPFVTEITKDNFEEKVLKSDKLVLIDFYADWCGPCKSMAPTVEKFAEQNQAKVSVVAVNIDKNPELAEAFGVRSIPTLVTMKSGNAILGSVGALPKSKLEELVQKSFAKLAAEQDNKPQPPQPKI